MMSGSPRAEDGSTFLGHPRGLAYLAFTEAWERFSFYGMQTLLVLYMVGQLLQPGHVENVLGFGQLRGVIEGVFGPLSTQALASMIYGLYAGFAMFLPVFGGVLGDRLLGRHRAVLLGAVLMAAGHFLMALEAPFLIALALLILGNGCLKANISAQVGALYGPADRRRTEAFQIFYIGVGAASLAAPLVCGTIGELVGWHYGFAVAGVGMLAALAIYVVGRRHLPPDVRQGGAAGEERPRLKPGDGRTIVALLSVLAITTCFQVGAAQLGNAFPIWVKGSVDRNAFGLTIPVTWFLAMAAVVPVAFPPLLLRFWRWQARRGAEPGMLTKMGMGCAIAAGCYLVLALLAWADVDGGAPWPWLAVALFLFGLGDLYLWPVGLALFSRAAPTAVKGMFMGIYFLSAFVGGNLVGWLGSRYEMMPHALFWMVHAAVLAGGALLVIVFGPLLSRILTPRETLPRA